MGVTPYQIKQMSFAEIERDLTLLGVTAVEDILQDNVRKCVLDFREAKCKFWILTGDAGPTAKQIGISCGVFSCNKSLVQIDSPDCLIQYI